jgi:hypothetical protein
MSIMQNIFQFQLVSEWELHTLYDEMFLRKYMKFELSLM